MAAPPCWARPEMRAPRPANARVARPGAGAATAPVNGPATVPAKGAVTGPMTDLATGPVTGLAIIDDIAFRSGPSCSPPPRRAGRLFPPAASWRPPAPGAASAAPARPGARTGRDPGGRLPRLAPLPPARHG